MVSVSNTLSGATHCRRLFSFNFLACDSLFFLERSLDFFIVSGLMFLCKVALAAMATETDTEAHGAASSSLCDLHRVRGPEMISG